ncbi:hypothetical protein [Flagellimonas marina]|uniref:Uncharacterized protein n=1 Tax=Flagellimonas marina TaxID=1775168 RepID=A0ABV8PJ82_9FLAO
MVKINLNHTAIPVASSVNYLLAFVWYVPLFGEVWAVGAEVSNPETPPLWATITSFSVGIMPSCGIAIILMYSNYRWAENRDLDLAGLFVTGRHRAMAVFRQILTLCGKHAVFHPVGLNLWTGHWQLAKPYLKINPKS